MQSKVEWQRKATAAICCRADVYTKQESKGSCRCQALTRKLKYEAKIQAEKRLWLNLFGASWVAAYA